RELDGGRAGGGAAGRFAGDLGAAVDAGAVRARGAAASSAGAVPRLLGAERHLHRPLLAALRPGWRRYGGLGPGGGVRAVAGTAASVVREGTRARPRAAS